MSTLEQLQTGLSEAWGTLTQGWQRLYRHAAGAITRFTQGEDPGRPGRETGLRSVGWGVLAAEVFDDDDRIVVRLEAPGMEKDDFDLQVVHDCLVIRGEKQVARERTAGHFRISECAYGRFERAIPLPDTVETGKVSARYRRGVLRIELPKSAARRRRHIRVDVG